MNAELKITSPDSDRTGRLLNKIAYETGKDMFNLVRQTMIFAAQSASKLTKPGLSGTADGMAKKYKQRPLLKSIEARPKKGKLGQYFYEFYNGKTFRTAVEIPSWQFGWQKINRKIDRVIQYWNKKENSWDYSAYTGSPENEKFKEIPHYGAAKVGWYGSLFKLGSNASGMGKNKSNLSQMQIMRGSLEAGITVTNMVDYAYKTSPGSADQALQKAESRMVKTYEKKLQMTISGAY